MNVPRPFNAILITLPTVLMLGGFAVALSEWEGVSPQAAPIPATAIARIVAVDPPLIATLDDAGTANAQRSEGDGPVAWWLAAGVVVGLASVFDAVSRRKVDGD